MDPARLQLMLNLEYAAVEVYGGCSTNPERGAQMLEAASRKMGDYWKSGAAVTFTASQPAEPLGPKEKQPTYTPHWFCYPGHECGECPVKPSEAKDNPIT